MNRLIATVAALAAASAASAQVVNGGFESPGTGFTTVPAGVTFGNWTNAGPSDIEFVRAEVNGGLPGLQFSAYEGQYWVDLVGVGNPSAIYQNITGLLPGGQYQIDWAQSGNVWGGNFNFTMEVVWNGVVVASNTQNHGGFDGSQMNWQLHSVVVTANLTAGPNQLMFRATTGGNARGPALDGVGMSLVPTPGAAALLGLGGLMVGRRRR